MKSRTWHKGRLQRNFSGLFLESDRNPTPTSLSGKGGLLAEILAEKIKELQRDLGDSENLKDQKSGLSAMRSLSFCSSFCSLDSVFQNSQPDKESKKKKKKKKEAFLLVSI